MPSNLAVRQTSKLDTKLMSDLDEAYRELKSAFSENDLAMTREHIKTIITIAVCLLQKINPKRPIGLYEIESTQGAKGAPIILKKIDHICSWSQEEISAFTLKIRGILHGYNQHGRDANLIPKLEDITSLSISS